MSLKIDIGLMNRQEVTPAGNEEQEDMDRSNSDSSLGEGASACGRSTPDGGDELEFYIPERRPSLDLGNPTRMDTSHW